MSSTSEGPASRWTLAVGAGILTIIFAAMLWVSSSAQASEVVYWDNYEDDAVAFANIDGSGGGPLNLTGVSLKSPEGMAYDSVTNRLFVDSSSGGPEGKGEILYINLDGSGAGVLSTPGAPIDDPEGIAIDPVTRMVYWSNVGTAESIAWAKLDGTGGGMLNTAGVTVESIYKLALDPVAGRVYWSYDPTGPGPESIAFANANNTGGGGTLSLAGASPPEDIRGLAVDPAGNHIYFLDAKGKRVSFASLAGGGGGDVNMTGAAFNGPYGLAFDPSLARLYWANYNNSAERIGAIGFAGVAGGGGGINITTAPLKGPQDPVILKSPTGTGAPAVTRSAKSRSSLSCSAGSWAADYPGSYVYQSPRSFAYQWTRNGTAIAGATATTFNAKSAGAYACTVTATNQTGSAVQASAGVKVKSAKVKLTTKKKVNVKPGGVAKFKLKGVNQGDVQSKKARVCVKLPKSAKGVLKAPKCSTLGKLKGRGKHGAILKIKVGKSAAGTYKVSFSVHGSPGTSAKATISVVAPKKK